VNQKPIPIAITIAEASALARVGRTLLYKNIRSGRLPARKLGNRTLILRTDLGKWLHDLPQLRANNSGIANAT
jgi:excisionase family DNA binding protein